MQEEMKIICYLSRPGAVNPVVVPGEWTPVPAVLGAGQSRIVLPNPAVQDPVQKLNSEAPWECT